MTDCHLETFSTELTGIENYTPNDIFKKIIMTMGTKNYTMLA